MIQRLCLLVFIALALTACEPVGPIPGKGLSGTETPVPSSWRFLDEIEVVQLETDGPYSVNIWVVGDDQYAYVAAAEGADSRWSAKIRIDPDVRLRVGDDIYLLKASVVTDKAALEPITELYKKKYALDAEEDFPEATVYRLEPR